MDDFKKDADFQLDFTLDAKAAVAEEDGVTYVEGYASDFGMDRQDEAFEPGAFTAGLKAFLKNPVVLYHHKFDEPLGRIIELDDRKNGLWVKAALDAPEPGTKTADIIRKVRSGTIKGFSVGGKFHRRKGPDGRARIHTADIAEISLTPLPINSRMLAAVVGKAFEEDVPEEGASAPDLAPLLERIVAVEGIFAQAAVAMEGKADLSTFGREKSSKKGHALPDGSYPIENEQDLKNAIHAIGRSKNPSAAKAHIIKRAKALGLTKLLPEGWS